MEKCRWKVPFRQVYCDTFVSWLKQTIWCLFVLKVFPYAADVGSDALLPTYLGHPQRFYDQYEHLLLEASGEAGPGMFIKSIREGAEKRPRTRLDPMTKVVLKEWELEDPFVQMLLDA